MDDTAPPGPADTSVVAREESLLWEPLRGFTTARIGLPRTGDSLATAPVLALRLAHARARDAVHVPLDATGLAAALTGNPILIESQAADRRDYLMRPDLGRALSPRAEAALRAVAGSFDLAVMIADGLCARAAQTQAAPLLARLRAVLADWRLAPPAIASLGRVALGDRVAEALGAGAVLVLIGERPGLSAADSLGAYLTWRPGPATTDADRNCVSNIRPEGIPAEQAAETIAWLLGRMRALGHSGIRLKDLAERRLA